MDRDIEQLLPTLEADTATRLAAFQAGVQAVRDARWEQMKHLEGTGPEVTRQEDLEIPSGAGPVQARLFVPNGPVRGAYLFIHGGGWALGTHRSGDPVMRRIASEAGVAVLSVGYRLAPEHPYPAGLDDCMAAASWLETNARQLGVEDPDALLIGGESAGGNLAAAVLLRRRDEGDRPFRAAVLTFGVFSLLLDLPSMREMWDRNLVLSGPIMQWFVDSYAPGRDLRHPYISPLYADLKGMPPALFIVGTLDHLYSDTLEMVAAWQKAGAPAELREFAGAPHGFTGMPVEAGRTAQSAVVEYIANAVAPVPASPR